MAKKQVIIVAGFHRSGTSAFTRAISLAGAHVSDHQLTTNSFNEKGYWEPVRLVQIQDEALSEADRDWDDLRPVPMAWMESPTGQHYVERLQNFMLDETADHDLIVTKDPRIGMLMPLWQHALGNAGIEALYVIPVRPPRAVVRSLQRRNGFSAEKSLWLWLNHNLAVERQTRGKKRVFVDYTDLLDSTLSTLETIWQGLGLGAPEIDDAARDAIADFITPSLNHSDDGEHVPLPAAITTAFDALKTACGSDGADLATTFDALASAQAWPRALLETLGEDVTVRTEAQHKELDGFYRTQIQTLNGTLDGLRHNAEERHAQSERQAREAAEAIDGLKSGQQHEIDVLRNEAKKQASESAEIITALKGERQDLKLYSDAFTQLYGNNHVPILSLRQKGHLLRRHGVSRGVGLIKQYELVRKSGLFSIPYYLAHYPDMRTHSINPLIHYLTHGHAEGRVPSGLFDGPGYKATYSDVNERNLNPLIHYLHFGQREGRLAKPGCADNVGQGSSARVTNFYTHLRFVTDYAPTELDPPLTPFDAKCMDIHYVIPDFAPGAGGHMTIFRIVRWLESFGHQVTLWIQNPSVHKTPKDAFNDINEHFQPVRAKVRFLPKDVSAMTGDAIIATDRWTAYPVRAMAKFRRRFYFVQDHESEFYPSGADSLLTEQTYRFGFDCLCAGEWLTHMMIEKYGLWAHKWDLAYDPTVYNTEGTETRKPGHIAFYARHATARRAVELGMLAFDVLAERGIDFHVDFYGTNLGDMKVPYAYTSHGILAADELGSLYRSCELGLVMSATNYSLVPREMIACGLPVVELDVDSTRAVFADTPVTLVEPDPYRMADALEALLSDQARCKDLSAKGLESVKKFCWETSARSVEAGLQNRMIKIT